MVYVRSSELAKVAFYAIGAAYPMTERRKNPKVEYKYADAYQQAKYHRNFHKNIVEDSILPLASIVKHPKPFPQAGAVDGPTDDFRKLILTQFDMLHKRLQDYASMLLPADQVEAYVTTLDKVYVTERDLLKNGPPPDGLAHYQAVPKYTADTF